MDKREGHGGDDETVRKNQSRQSKTERDMTAALQFIILLFLFSLHLIVTQNNIRSNPISRSKDVEALVELLFPNRTAESSSDSRRLQVEKVPYNASNPVPCVICRGLKKCTILNGFLVQETYYPKNLNYRETCKVIDKFGARIEELVFGNGKTFRDTPQCREIVMQYLCLHYGTDNDMYTNYCVFQETTDPVDQIKTLAQRPPCHSFCVQVAMICANEPDFFIQTCERITCPYPKDKTCTADPVLQGLPLESNLGCSVPYYDSPYFRAGGGTSAPNFILSSLIVGITLLILNVNR